MRVPRGGHTYLVHVSCFPCWVLLGPSLCFSREAGKYFSFLRGSAGPFPSSVQEKFSGPNLSPFPKQHQPNATGPLAGNKRLPLPTLQRWLAVKRKTVSAFSHEQRTPRWKVHAGKARSIQRLTPQLSLRRRPAKRIDPILFPWPRLIKQADYNRSPSHSTPPPPPPPAPHNPSPTGSPRPAFWASAFLRPEKEGRLRTGTPLASCFSHAPRFFHMGCRADRLPFPPLPCPFWTESWDCSFGPVPCSLWDARCSESIS